MSKIEVIGRGAFTKVWGIDGNNAVIATICPVKNALSEYDGGRMTPTYEFRGSIESHPEVSVLLSPKYEKLTAPKRQLTTLYYKYYQYLLKAFRKPTGSTGWYYSSIKGYHDILEVCEGFKLKGLRDELVGIVMHLSNYINPYDLCMEVSPRNLMAYNGKLVLNDLFFDWSVIDVNGYYPEPLKQLHYTSVKNILEDGNE